MNLPRNRVKTTTIMRGLENPNFSRKDKGMGQNPTESTRSKVGMAMKQTNSIRQLSR